MRITKLIEELEKVRAAAGDCVVAVEIEIALFDADKEEDECEIFSVYMSHTKIGGAQVVNLGL